MMPSSLTISPRFFLIASRIFSLWRSWSICPLRCNDQSCWETDIEHTPFHIRRVQPVALIHCPIGYGAQRHWTLQPLSIQQAPGIAKYLIRAYMTVAMLSHEAIDDLIDLP